jgi:lysophospholipase L1-like esterase
MRVVLLGDSILDNAPYTTPKPDTAAHLQRFLGPDASVQLLARDGGTMGDVDFQLAELEGTPDAAVLSIGGNDVTRHIGILSRHASGSAEVLDELLSVGDDFGRRYEKVARTVAARASRTVLCTIYEVPLEPPPLARLARAPLAVLNDRIIRTGARLGLDVLELRSVCTAPKHFVKQIEPSARGAKRIAAAIAGVLRGDASLTSARVFGL